MSPRQARLDSCASIGLYIKECVLLSEHEKLNYVEFPVKDIHVAKDFFAKVFSWRFEDFGDAYTAFYDAGIDGGFFKSDQTVQASLGSVLLVFYSDNLEMTMEKILAAKGSISQDIFSFPGGRRFHFLDPNGNEYAVWSKS